VKFRFEADLPHQQGAIEAVCGLFDGQAPETSVFTVAPPAKEWQLPLGDSKLGYGNRLTLLEDEVLANLQKVQAANALPISTSLSWKDMDFTVEMETGTGKTYVYLRTIFELNRRYGFTKFVIVVPSVAIREGVKKSIEQTAEHFRALYDGVPFQHFVYDSGDLARVRDFATANSIRVMIATIQSLGSKAAVFQQAREQTLDIPAVEWVADCKPIIIIDEPQSVDANAEGAGAKILRLMKPMARLRYSATHVRQFHQIYRLDAFDAHEQGLVKSIAVDGASIKDADNSPYVKLLQVEARKGHVPRARLEISVQQAASVSRKSEWAHDGDELFELSGNRTIYAGMRVGDIDARQGGSVQIMSPGKDPDILAVGASINDVDGMSVQRAMVRQTIEHHFKRELANRPLGIKTLSLFFIGQVADYRRYADDGTAQPGPLVAIFEEEYAKLAAKADYASLFADVPADAKAAHEGYFAMDKQRRFIEPAVNAAGELSNQTSREAAERAFDLIMKHKERLLDEAEPLRFIFSHSALREGWDNPNVFQICVLRSMGTERQRRQSIGRGLRLAVDRHGVRRRDEGINRLTVVSDEDFSSFADGLQKEIEADLGVKMGVVSQGLFAGLQYPMPDGSIGMLSVAESDSVFVALRAAGMVEKDGKVNERLKEALRAGTVPLPPNLPEAAQHVIRHRLMRLTRKIKITDASKTGETKLNLAILDSHEFKELWKRISAKTTYRLAFDDATLIAAGAKAIADMPPPGEARITFTEAGLSVTREGVEAKVQAISAPRKLQTQKLPVPDLLTELMNRTDLPRRVIARMLIDSGRLDEASINPTAFMDAVTGCIKAAKLKVLADGVQYRRIEDEAWSQELFQPEGGLDPARMIEVSKAPVSHIVYDSETVERQLAADMDKSAAIKVFAKLPRAFTIPTPLGTYNPDWAIVREREDEKLVYLVCETKGDLNNLRDEERAKIDCGKAHFKQVEAKFITATSLDGVLAAC
jgi:type III restriction enzyme